MAASYFSIPTTTHQTLNALPPVSSSSLRIHCSHVRIVSSIPKSMSITPSYFLQFSYVLSAIVPALNRIKAFRITALAQEETQITEEQVAQQLSEETKTVQEKEDKEEQKTKTVSPPKGAKLFVGNLPRSCDNEQITQIFKECGTVESAEVICNEDTGISRGFAFVTMSTVDEAKAAIEKLQGFDLGGRDMIVNFPARLLTRKREGEQEWNNFVETPYKVYVGGVPRVFGFVSLSSQSEVEAAIASLHKSELHGRKLLVTEAKAKIEIGSKPDKLILLSDPASVLGRVVNASVVYQQLSKSKALPSHKHLFTLDAGHVEFSWVTCFHAKLSNRLSVSTEESIVWVWTIQSLRGLPQRVVKWSAWNMNSTGVLICIYCISRAHPGSVVEMAVPLSSEGNLGRSRVYGFVCFSSQSEVQAAIASLDEKEFQERKLVVKEAKVKSEI
eukprot:Gb_28108 [translate_table: standard]